MLKRVGARLKGKTKMGDERFGYNKYIGISNLSLGFRLKAKSWKVLKSIYVETEKARFKM